MLVSSHLLSEVQQTADRVVILSQGRLVREGSIAELTAGVGETVAVRSPQVDALAAALVGSPAEVTRIGPDQLLVKGLEAARVGHAAFTAGVELHELRTERADLEQLFFSLTQGQFPAAVPPGGPPPPGPQPPYAAPAPAGQGASQGGGR